MTTDSLRRKYLDYFKSKNHRVFPSDSLVPADDPSLLFTGAGMNQFKPYFLGLKKDLKRATSCQKCLRTADLTQVGKTATHHSFFEMLGNFSFGDYFKEEAIVWSWEFVTRELGLPKERLWVSVYDNDPEAADLWRKKVGLPESRIQSLGAVDNFWPSNAPKDGPNGPCGPCSEIYVGKTRDKSVEIWNLVFTQFDRQSDGSLKNLPQKSIDTGLGLERCAAVIQGADSNFDIDTFTDLRKEVHRLLKKGGVERSHENAVMDHIRAATFAIADGVLPSNEGRGYVIRKIIRLATDHLNKAGAIERGTLYKLVPAVIRVMGTAYPDLADKQKSITSIIEHEEKSYFQACRRAEAARQGTMKDEEFAFMLYDTHGLPIDQIRAKFEKEGKNFNEQIFQECLEEQRDRSRRSSSIAADIFSMDSKIALVAGLPATHFTGYQTLKTDAKLLRLFRYDSSVAAFGAGEDGIVIFDRSPFYPESGGQIGDTGVIQAADFKASVTDTQWMEKCIAHKVHVDYGEAGVGKSCKLLVDADRRSDIMKNHTATHLLHSALRQGLGDHVKQSGSLVAEDYLRFDFTHSSALTEMEAAKVEALVNAEILKNTTLQKKIMSKDQAQKSGAIAFYGEKYGAEVRVVTIGDFSKEFCGGTHLETTGQIGLFKILSEGSIQAGVRRIIAVTGRAAEALVKQNTRELGALTEEFSLKGSDFKNEFQTRQKRVKELKMKLFASASHAMNSKTRELAQAAPETQGVKRVFASFAHADIDLLRNQAQFLKDQKLKFVAMFCAPAEDKLSYIIAASGDVVSEGWNSNQFLQTVNRELGGKGGGGPDFAVGGTKNPDAPDKAEKIFETGTAGMLSTLGLQ